jgi:hypothetical protein
MNLQPARFSIDTLGEDVLFDGFTADETWNGWACPYFTFEQAQKVVNAFNVSQHFVNDRVSAHYDAERDAFCFLLETSGESDDFPAVSIDGQKFYPIGAGCWIWERSDKWNNRQPEVIS